ncbi:hypothetical protein [Streptomyces sp. NPDC002520]
MKVRADVAELLQDGLSNAEISRRLGIHPGKVGEARRALRLPDYRDMKVGPIAGQSHRDHGTRAKYVVEKCRCKPCREANRLEHGNSSRLQAYGRWQPYVDAGPAREHVKALQAYGLGWKRIAHLADVPTGAVAKLLYGDSRRGMAPSMRVRPETEAKLLAVKPTPGNLGGHTTTEGTGTGRRLQALIAGGWPQAQLARRLAMEPSNFGLTLHSERVLMSTARAVSQLYDELWNADPLNHGVSLQAVSRARNQARAKQWAPVGAWDEDTIDDPIAKPDWTGQCGTPEGYFAHRRHRLLPACQPCKDAHTAVGLARKAGAA